MSKIRKWLRLVPCILLACLLLVGCGNGTEPDSQAQEPNSTRSEEGEHSGSDVQNETPKELEIETPVGTLIFPEAWAGAVQMKDTSADGQYAVSFYGTVGGEDVLLFELSVGAKEGDYQLGSAPDAAGNMQSVWLNIKEIEAKPEWSAEETTQINTMQECVNDLIDQLNQMDGFRAAS